MVIFFSFCQIRFACIDVVMSVCDLVHDVETVYGIVMSLCDLVHDVETVYDVVMSLCDLVHDVETVYDVVMSLCDQDCIWCCYVTV